MKKIIVLLVMLVLALAGALTALLYQGSGATHGDILAAVQGEGEATRDHVDLRARELAGKLDGIDAKLDRLLKIAEKPLPDGL